MGVYEARLDAGVVIAHRAINGGWMMIAPGASRLTRMAAVVASLQPCGCTFKRARFVPSVN